MSRRHVQVAVPALALRRDEAAAALGVSIETFDAHVRAELPAVRVGSVTTYPVAGLQSWLAERATSVLQDIGRTA